MRLVLPSDDIRAAYPTYDASSTLIFGACCLCIIGEEHGPFKIARTTTPLGHFQNVCKNSFLDLKLWLISRVPVGIEREIEAKARAMIIDSEIKYGWFDVELETARKTVAHANPLGPFISLKGLSVETSLWL